MWEGKTTRARYSDTDEDGEAVAVVEARVDAKVEADAQSRSTAKQVWDELEL